MKTVNNLFKLLIICFLTIISFKGEARNCGKFMGKYIHTYGNLSCDKAKLVYKSFNKGKTPKGWICGQSVKGCGRGKQGFTF